jgi:hypothetical protein
VHRATESSGIPAGAGGGAVRTGVGYCVSGDWSETGETAQRRSEHGTYGRAAASSARFGGARLLRRSCRDPAEQRLVIYSPGSVAPAGSPHVSSHLHSHLSNA